MFRKPYKVKTSTTIKGSDRRRLRSLIENQFPSLTVEDLNALIPNKNEMNQVKAMTHGGNIVMIYYSNTSPIFFQINDICYPTIYTLWKYPNLLPRVTTVPAVLEKICNGADLMAPGIVINELTVAEMETLKPSNSCSIRMLGNKSAIAVGTAIMSVEELCIDGIKGKAVTVVHTYKDNLWLSGNCQDLPLIPDEIMSDIHDGVQNINLEDEIEPKISSDSTSVASFEHTENINEETADESVSEDKVPEYTMDDILYNSFMSALKAYGKKIQLPILTSTFYSSYVLKSCPSQLNLDIKKTTYKKLSVFLKKMQKDGLVQIKELTKGVESIVSISLENENIKSFFVDNMFKNHIQALKNEKSVDEESSLNVQENYKFPSVTELFVVSAQVKTLFEFAHIRKGDTIPASSVREVLKLYVKENSLQNEKNPKEIILDPILADCISKKGDSRTVMAWDELFEAIVCKMPHAYQITFEEKEPITKKGKLEPIQVTVDTRTGNKKVTLIQNLETYGINPEKLAQHVQVAVAASTSITPTQNGKGNIVLIQGNQVRYLQKLFLETYKVPRKHLQGLENVPKKK